MRKEDPAALKDVIIEIQKRVNQCLLFVLALLMLLSNNGRQTIEFPREIHARHVARVKEQQIGR